MALQHGPGPFVMSILLTLRNSKKAGLVKQAFLIKDMALVKLLTYSLYTSKTMDLENFGEEMGGQCQEPPQIPRDPKIHF